MNLMNNAVIQTPRPFNEPILDHAPGSPERAALKKALDEAASREIEVPLDTRRVASQETITRTMITPQVKTMVALRESMRVCRVISSITAIFFAMVCMATTDSATASPL